MFGELVVGCLKTTNFFGEVEIQKSKKALNFPPHNEDSRSTVNIQ